MQTLSTASNQDLITSGRQHQIWDNKLVLMSHDSQIQVHFVKTILACQENVYTEVTIFSVHWAELIFASALMPLGSPLVG